MKTKNVLSLIIAGMFAIASIGQNQQIPNGGFENWHAQGQGEDPDEWGSLFNQFNSPYVLVSKTPDANSGLNALKIVCDTGTVAPPLGTGNSGDTIYGSLFLGLTNAQVGNAKIPFSSIPDSLSGYMKGTVVNGGFFMNMKLFNAGQNIANANYFFVSSVTNYTRFSVPVLYSQSVTPDTMTFSIIAVHPGMSPSADPNNEFYIDDLTLIYGSTGMNGNPSELGLSIYPNPVSNQLKIENNCDENLFLKIMDNTGKKIAESELHQGKNSLSVPEFSSGLYFLQVTNSYGKILRSEKLMKQ